MFWFSLFVFVLLGAVLGSFATAIIHRVKNNQSWIIGKDKSAARSACPECSHVLFTLDLIPIFSWLYLKGRCRYCDAHISTQYIWVEIMSVIVSVVVFLFTATVITALLYLLLLPFILAQMVLFVQNRFISTQLCFIIGVIIVSYTVFYYT